MANKRKIGDTDEWGFTLLKRSGRVELYQTPKGYYTIYLTVNEDEYLTVVRKKLEKAAKLFNSICDMLSH